MEDSGYGFELYNLGENKYSILGGTNRGKTLEELVKNQYSIEDLQDQLKSIVTKDGLPTTITIMHMDSFCLPNMEQKVIKEIINYCKSLGQRPTKHGLSSGQYKAFNMETGQFYVPDANTELVVKVEHTHVNKDPMSNLQSLLASVEMFEKMK